MIRIDHTAGGRGRPSRREFLQVGASGLLGLSLPGLLRAQEAGLADRGNGVSCILLFLWGGPPQSDTFDLKPDAPSAYRGPFKPIDTRSPGLQVCQHLPLLARSSRLYTVVRSAHHRDTEHPRAAHHVMTGSQVIRGREWPNLGAAVDRFGGGGGDGARSRDGLGAVVIGPRLRDAPITPTGQDGGFLGNVHAPFRIPDATAPLERIAALRPPEGIGPERLARRARLFRTLDELQRRVEGDSAAALDAAYQRAFSLVTSPRARRALDLSLEPARVRERYGTHPFGQGALLARRLVEAGVRFVQVNWREHPIEDHGFDNHGDNFGRLGTQLPQLDLTLSALLEDLQARGLLETTLVLATGEFGRTPLINGGSGRDHWPFCFSYVIAGAGIPGGRAIGRSDELAAYPVDDPVEPENTVASVYSLLGLDLEKLRAAGVIAGTEGIPRLFS